ncbi:MAG: 3-hydroxyacyl-CoA dehydrogenase NAD-binding domain-containing protein, partial [Proteobacteria bacterium]|nr:3-hydroxyacyl-CoA dehydrogenase NAD-binding domain-containing protein [Pseudomonadota bacterium]
MQLDVNRSDLTVGIIGAGAMGRGIAQVAAAGGMQVLITDSRDGAAKEARDFVDKLFLRAAEKGSMTKEAAAAATARIKVVSTLAEFKACHL